MNLASSLFTKLTLQHTLSVLSVTIFCHLMADIPAHANQTHAFYIMTFPQPFWKSQVSISQLHVFVNTLVLWQYIRICERLLHW